MKTIPTAEEFFNKEADKLKSAKEDMPQWMIEKSIEFAKLHVEQALKEASEKATMKVEYPDEAYQECGVVLLPTDKPSKLCYVNLRSILYWNEKTHDKTEWTEPQNLYILSDEEIKEGDYRYSKIQNNVQIATKTDVETGYYKERKTDYFKVIATTDSSLKAPFTRPDGVFRDLIKPLSQIPQSFIEYFINEYNKGNVISKVLVEVEEKLYQQRLSTPVDLGLGVFKYDEGVRRVEIKLNQNNEISILTEQKQMFSREEVTELLRLAWATAFAYGENTNEADCMDWINHNLH